MTTNENDFSECIVCFKANTNKVDWSACRDVMNGHGDCPYIPEYLPNNQIKRWLEIGVKKYVKENKSI